MNQEEETGLFGKTSSQSEIVETLFVLFRYILFVYS